MTAMDSALPPEAPALADAGASEGPPLYGLPPELIPDLDALITEDGKPVDNIYVERQYKLLTEPLYVSWGGPGEGRSFLALSNVGWFHADKEPPLVPDVLLSLDVRPREPRTKEGRSYIQWVLGKPPELVIEIVSDRRGGEDSTKLRQYERQHLLFYVIYDPEEFLEEGVLRVFENRRGKFTPIEPGWIAELGLGLRLWEGEYMGVRETWLRWCDQEQKVLLTGAERAAQAEERIRRLEEQLRAKGIEPQP
jgi:Uma2 family endonuclease